MADYVRAHTLGSVLRSSLRIYFNHWRVVLGICALPVAPIYLLIYWATLTSANPEFIAAGDLAVTALQILTATALTFAVGEISVGSVPSIKHAFQRIFAAPGRILGTSFLWILLLLLGAFIVAIPLLLPVQYFLGPIFTLFDTVLMVGLVAPGFVVGVFFLFVPQVTALEGVGGGAAIGRARELGRGFYLRNLGVCVLFALIVKASTILTGFALQALLLASLPLVGPFLNFAGYLPATVTILVSVSITPILLLAIVLLYFDVRVRKEGYSTAQLLQDLKFDVNVPVFAYKRFLIALASCALLALVSTLGFYLVQSLDYPSKNVQAGDADYPTKNSSPRKFILIHGTIDESLDLVFNVGWHASNKACQYYLSRTEGALSPFGASSPLTLERDGSNFTIKLAVDGVDPGRCGWTFGGVGMGPKKGFGQSLIQTNTNRASLGPSPNGTINLRCEITMRTSPTAEQLVCSRPKSEDRSESVRGGILWWRPETSDLEVHIAKGR